MSQSGGSGGGGGSQDPSSSQPGSQRKIQYTQLEEDMIRDALKVGLTINQPNQIARFIYNRRAELPPNLLHFYGMVEEGDGPIQFRSMIIISSMHIQMLS